MKLIDLTHTIVDDLPVFPGDLPTKLRQTKKLQTDGHNNHRIEIGMHAGTHIDAAMHMTDSTVYISDLELNDLVGPGCLLDVRNQAVISMQQHYQEIVQPGMMVLLWTGHDHFYGKQRYFTESPQVGEDLAEFFVERQVKIVGMDIAGPDQEPHRIHKLLFNHNILIVENLTNLHRLQQCQDFTVMVFPLKIKADGAPARVAASIKA